MKINVIQLPHMGARIGNRFLQIGEFVPAVAMSARRLTIEELEDPVRLQGLYTTQRRMASTLGSALPCETELKTSLTRYLRKVNLEIARFEHTPEFDLPTLDPSFLSWKTQAGFPAFSIFHLDSDTMKISFGLTSRLSIPFTDIIGASLTPEQLDGILADLRERSTKPVPGRDILVTPAIPDIMAKHYLDEGLLRNLAGRCTRCNLSGMELTAKYGGAMPDTVRENIHKWTNVSTGQPRFDRNEVLIVAEAPDESWQVKDIPRLDPLVIGIAHGLLWLVDAFDLTPVEKLARELCAGSLKATN